MTRMMDNDDKAETVAIMAKGTTMTMAAIGQDEDDDDDSLQQSNQTLESNNQQ